ncbi:MAG: histidine phosphatase family protein [Alphaproteobacteria bacterium]|nr:MAG: histidine phosphatase family protein [Alphaproteobacteria bacterium]
MSIISQTRAESTQRGNFRRVLARVKSAFDELIEMHKDFLIVAHGAVFIALKMAGVQSNIEHLDHCTLIEFEHFGDFWRAVKYE